MLQRVAKIVLVVCLPLAPSATFADTGKGERIGLASSADYDECQEIMPPSLGKVWEIEQDWMRSCLFGEAAHTPDYPDTAPLYESCRLSMQAAGNHDLLAFHTCVAEKINDR